jgi:hypothetical protein
MFLYLLLSNPFVSIPFLLKFLIVCFGKFSTTLRMNTLRAKLDDALIEILTKIL